MSTDWKNTSYDSILLIVGLQDKPVQISHYTREAGDNFRHFPAFFVLLPRHQANYDSVAVVVNRLKKMLRIEPVQMIDAPGLRRSLSPSTRCQRPRLGLHLQVLVPPVPLSNSTAVTTYENIK